MSSQWLNSFPSEGTQVRIYVKVDGTKSRTNLKKKMSEAAERLGTGMKVHLPAGKKTVKRIIRKLAPVYSVPSKIK